MAIRDKKLGLDSIIESRKPVSKRNTQQNKRNKKQAKIDKIKFKSVQSHTTTGVVSAIQQGLDNPVNKITSDFVGATIAISNPHQLVDTDKYPTTRFVLPTSYSTTISRVINDTTFEVKESYKVQDDTLNDIPVSLRSATNNATITYETFDEEQEDTIYQRSYADLTIGNLKTFSGDVYKAKIYARENGSSTDFEEIYETIVTPENSLVDKTSINSYEDIGFFHKQNTIDTYWVSSSTQTTPSAGHTCVNVDNSRLVDGALISGSVAKLGHTTTFRTKNSFDLEKGVDYQVKFNSYYFKDVAERRENDETINEGSFASLKVYISGSAITGQDGEEDYYLGEVDIPESSSPQDFVYNVTGNFKTSNTGSPKAWLKFELNSGRFIVQNVSVEPFNEVNFNPNFFKVLVPLPKQVKRGASIDFLVEFYDSDNNKSEISAQTNNTTFIGPRQVLADGLDGIFSGSMVIGQSLQMYGVNPAYIRTVGYQGFDKTIAGTGTTNGGFLLWSGSVGSGAPGGNTLTSSEAYNGVGIEVVDASAADSTDHKFFQFASNHKNTGTSKFRVQTDEFFLGKKAQFISGSNGNIVISSSNFFLGGGSSFVSGSNDKLEISSSNFHLDNNGDVTLVGEITAEAGGTIGGFLIGSSSISKDNVLTISSSTNTADPASFISSSAFKVSAGGTITGSNILLTGGKITSDVTVEGTFAANSILTPATIGGSPTTVANASASIDANGNAVFRSGSIGGFRMDATTLFSDSAEFVVTGSTGQITGSNVLFTGGKVGGFEIDSDGINSINDSFQVTGSTGQITGSSVLFTGGKVGGFEIDSDGINSLNDVFQITGSTGQITASNAKITGNITATSGEIGGLTIRANNLNSDGHQFQVTGSTGQITGSNVLFDGGKIGGWAFNDKKLSSFSTSTQDKFGIAIDADYQLITIHGNSGDGKNNIGDNDRDNVMVALGQLTDDEFGIKGFTTAGNRAFELSTTRLEIAGWTFDNEKISSNNLIINSAGTIETATFVSGLKGFRLSADNNGSLEVEEAKIRGTLSTTVFEKESINAVGGQLVVANSTMITGSSVFPTGSFGSTDTTMSVVNSSGFINGEILVLKKVTGTGFTTEYVQVDSASRLSTDDNDLTGLLMVTRSLNDEFEPGKHSGSLSDVTASAQSYEPGQVVVSTGRIGTGYIRLNANPSDTTTPYIDIVERTGSKVFEVDLKARLGDLSGLSSALVGSSPGFGLFSENVFLTGKVTATSGKIAEWDIDGNKLSSINASKKGITLDADPSVPIITISASSGTGVDKFNKLEMYHATDSNWGLKGFSDGDVVFRLGSTNEIGGFGITATEISSSNENLILKSNGQITASAAKISGDITITSGDLAGVDAASISGSYPPASASQDFGIAKQVVVSGTGVDIKNSSEQTIASYGGSAKMFGGANNTADFAEVSADGLTIVANSNTASIMNAGGTTIMGGTATASINSSGITLIGGGQTGSFIDANGMEIYGASDKNERVLVNSTGVSILANNITGSSFTNETSSIFGSNDKHERVELVGEGLKIYESNHQVASYGNTIRVGRADEAHQTISATTTQFLDGDGSTVRLNISNDGNIDLRDSGGNVKVQADTAGVKVISDNTSTFGLFNASGLTLVDNNVTSSIFDSTGTTIYGGTSATASLDANDISFMVGGVTSSKFTATTSSMFGASSNDRVEITDAGLKVYESNKQMVNVGSSGLDVYDTSNNRVAQFASTTTIGSSTDKVSISDGNITLRADNVDEFKVTNGLVTIGNTSGAQILMDTVGGTSGIQIKDRDNAEIAFIGETNAIAGRTSAGSPLPTANAVRGIVTDGLTGNILSITGSANVGGLVASGSVRNTSNGAATAVMIHVADNSNTYFQVLNDGEVLARDNITAFTTGFTSISDKRLKEDVYPISDSLNKIVKLEPSHFTWIEKQEQDIGFIAQEVEEIIPEVIHETKGFVDIDSNEQDDTTYKSISYDKLTVYLVGAVKELTKRIEDLEERFIRK